MMFITFGNHLVNESEDTYFLFERYKKNKIEVVQRFLHVERSFHNQPFLCGRVLNKDELINIKELIEEELKEFE